MPHSVTVYTAEHCLNVNADKIFSKNKWRLCNKLVVSVQYMFIPAHSLWPKIVLLFQALVLFQQLVLRWPSFELQCGVCIPQCYVVQSTSSIRKKTNVASLLLLIFGRMENAAQNVCFINFEVPKFQWRFGCIQ